MIDRVVLPGGEEELQRARHLLHQRLAKRLQHLADVIIGQTALLFRQPRLFEGQAIAALDFLGQLPAAEQLLAGIDDLAIVQDAERGHGRADVDHSDSQTLLRSRQLRGQQAERALQRIGFDVDYPCGQPGEGQRRFTNFDVFLATGSEQHIDPLRVAR
ncbi:hypothetical protein D3C81_1517840 [compost metagenome]